MSQILYTEQDTFDALRRIPIDEMQACISSIIPAPHLTFEYIKNETGWDLIDYVNENNDAWVAYWYAKRVLKERWPEAEKCIKQHRGWWSQYKQAFYIK